MKCTKSPFGLASWAGAIYLLLMLWTAAWAEEALLPAQQVVQKTSDSLQASLQKPEYKQDFRKATALVEQVIEPHVNFKQISILVLGKYWKTATPEQQERFKKEFRMLVVRTYTTAFTEYSDWKIRYLPVQEDAGGKKLLVRTEVLQAGAQPVGVNYRMAIEDGNWKVYDVLIEGVSLLQNYRTSFTEEVGRTGSLDQLIERLAERNANAMKEPLTAVPGAPQGS